MSPIRRTNILTSVTFTLLLFCIFSVTSQAAVQDGLIAYWPLDENSGSAAVDVINGHNGTLMGGITWVSGKLGYAVDTHNSGYIVVPENSQLRPGTAVSLQAWVIVDSFSLWDGIAGNIQDNGSNESGYCMYTNSSGMDWYVSVNGSFVTTSSPCPTGQWNHFVGTYDGSAVKFYYNGQLVANQPASGSINWTFIPLDFNIGRYHDDNENNIADVKVDEVALWNRALFPDEVEFLYNGGAGNAVTSSAYVQIIESDGYTAVTEGGPDDSYEVVLWSEPTDNVQITAVPADDQIDLGQGPGNPAIITFTELNWNNPQTISVSANDDAVYEGEEPHETVITHTAQGGGYDDVNIASVTVNVIDDELTCGDWGYFDTDLNKDCYVNILDFAMFAENWLKSPT